MMKRYILCIALVSALTGSTFGGMLFDSGGFEAYANNSALVGQFGWLDFNPPNGNRFNVQSAVTNGGNRAVSASAADAIAAFVAPAVNFTPTARQIVVIEVDIARTIAQFPFNASSPGFDVDVYNESGNRILGFGLGVNEANTAIAPFVTRGDGSLFGVSDPISLAVNSRQFVRFRAELNFDTDTFRLFVDGTDVTGVLPFVNASSVLADADLQHDSTVNATDVGYFDNYSISFFVRGDANGDDSLTNSDISPFILALTDPAAYAAQYPNVDPDVVLDFNGDGRFSNADIAGFIDALAGP